MEVRKFWGSDRRAWLIGLLFITITRMAFAGGPFKPGDLGWQEGDADNPYHGKKATTDEEKEVHEEALHSVDEARSAILDYFNRGRYVIRTITPPERSEENEKMSFAINLEGYGKLLSKGLSLTHSAAEALDLLAFHPTMTYMHLNPFMDKVDRRNLYSQAVASAVTANLSHLKSPGFASEGEMEVLSAFVGNLGAYDPTQAKTYLDLAWNIEPSVAAANHIIREHWMSAQDYRYLVGKTGAPSASLASPSWVADAWNGACSRILGILGLGR